MDDYVDVLIANLKVLSGVPNAGRLAIRRGQLSVDSTIHGQFLVRMFYGDSRDTTLQHVRNTVAGAVRIAEAIMQAPGEPDWKSVWTLERLAEEMERAEAGLRNLRATYSADSGTTASLQVLSERLASHHADISRYFAARSSADGVGSP